MVFANTAAAISLSLHAARSNMDEKTTLIQDIEKGGTKEENERFCGSRLCALFFIVLLLIGTIYLIISFIITVIKFEADDGHLGKHIEELYKDSIEGNYGS